MSRPGTALCVLEAVFRQEGAGNERTLAETREPGKRFVHETECDGEWQCEFL